MATLIEILGTIFGEWLQDGPKKGKLGALRRGLIVALFFGLIGLTLYAYFSS